MTTEVERMLSDVVKINKKFGDGRMKLGNDGSLTLGAFTTGSVMLDLALGGGYPIGRMVELFGMQSSGKTMMALHAIREKQKLGGLCAFIDIERTITTDRMLDLGIDVSSLVVVEPEYAEDAIDHIEALINSGVKLIVVDSVAAMLPRQEANAETGDTQVMIMGRIMSKAMRKLTGICHKNRCTIIFINQVRKTITMSRDNNITTGGNALPFYASQRIKIHRNPSEASQLKDANKNAIGSNVQFTVVKNKTAAPFEKIVLKIYYDGFIDEIDDIKKVINNYGLIRKGSGVYYVKYGEHKIKLGTKSESIIDLLKSRKSRIQITKMILECYNDIRKKESELIRSRYL